MRTMTSPEIVQARGFDADGTLEQAHRLLEQCDGDVVVAQRTGDRAAIDVATARHTSVESALARFVGAMPALLDGEREHAEASAARVVADHVVMVGTLDEQAALSTFSALVVARAREAARLNLLPALRAPVRAQANVLGKLRTDQVAKGRATAFESSETIMRQLFSSASYHREGAISLAAEHGRAANASIAAWWPIAESVVRASFVKEFKEAWAPFKNTHRVPGFGEDLKVEDLDECFATRRMGLASARRDAEARIASLQAEVGK